jgi:hypothetical protein
MPSKLRNFFRIGSSAPSSPSPRTRDFPPSPSRSKKGGDAASPSGARSGSVSYGAAPDDDLLPSPSQSSSADYDDASPSIRWHGDSISSNIGGAGADVFLSRSTSAGAASPSAVGFINDALTNSDEGHWDSGIFFFVQMLQNFCEEDKQFGGREKKALEMVVHDVEEGNVTHIVVLKKVVDKFYYSETLQWQCHEDILTPCIAAIVSCENGRKWCEGRLQYELFRVNNFSPNQVGILALIANGLYDYYHNDPTELNSEEWFNLLNDLIARISNGVRLGILLSNEPSPISGIISDEPSPRGGIISLIQCTENGTDHLIYLLKIILNTEPKLAYNRHEKSTLKLDAYILRQLLVVTELITNELHKYNNAVINDKLHKLVANKATKVANLIRGYCAAHEEHHDPDECNYSSVSGATGTFDFTRNSSGEAIRRGQRYHSSSTFDPRDIHGPTLVHQWEPQRSGEHTQGHFSPPIEGSFESHHTGGASRDYAAAQPNRSRPPSTPSSGYHSPTHELPPRLNTNFAPPSYDPRSAPPLPDTPPSDGDPPKTKRKKSSSRLHSGHAPAASELGAPQASAVCAAAEEQDLRASVARQIAAHKAEQMATHEAKGTQGDKSKRCKFGRSLSLSNLPDLTPSLQSRPGSPTSKAHEVITIPERFTLAVSQTNLVTGNLIPLTSSKAQITHASSMPTTPRAGHKSANALQWTHSDPAERSITN